MKLKFVVKTENEHGNNCYLGKTSESGQYQFLRSSSLASVFCTKEEAIDAYKTTYNSSDLPVIIEVIINEE